MRRGSVVALLFTLVLAIVASQGLSSGTQAQDATPPAGQQDGAPEGVSLTTLAFGTVEVLAPGTANLGLGRMRLAPGATLPFDPTDASVNLVFVSSGTFTFRVEAPMKVVRGATAANPAPMEPEEIPAGTEFTMGDGDAALFPPNASGEARNDGDEDATAWVSALALFTATASTPTP